MCEQQSGRRQMPAPGGAGILIDGFRNPCRTRQACSFVGFSATIASVVTSRLATVLGTSRTAGHRSFRGKLHIRCQNLTSFSFGERQVIRSFR